MKKGKSEQQPAARKKVTFYADPDIAEWLDSLDSGLKSKEINTLLRSRSDQKSSIEMRLNLIETHLKKLDKEVQFDGCAIAAIRAVLYSHFGDATKTEFKKNYDDFYFGSPRIRRDY
ncbi:MAG: hypothetical protein JST44_24865 [Cyanobacteria bacterium SZAS LIN-5]|nr:hypothetical protein [Cyanobacteria bacterium SZAS LIN-5]